VGDADFSTISVILGERTASRPISERGTAGCEERTADGPDLAEWDEPARREFGFQLRVARCNLALPASIPAPYETSFISRVRPSVSAVALTISNVTPRKNHAPRSSRHDQRDK